MRRADEGAHGLHEILRQALAAEVDPSFADLAARLRALTKGRARTPAERPQREGRDER